MEAPLGRIRQVVALGGNGLAGPARAEVDGTVDAGVSRAILAGPLLGQLFLRAVLDGLEGVEENTDDHDAEQHPGKGLFETPVKLGLGGGSTKHQILHL